MSEGAVGKALVIRHSNGKMIRQAMKMGHRGDADQLKGKRVKRVEWWVTTMSAATTRPLYN